MNGTMAASSHRIMLGPLVAAIDQGTSSTRFLNRADVLPAEASFFLSLKVFNSKTAELLSHHQVEIKQSFPKEGWVEEDPKEILQSVYECMERTCEKLTQLNIDISNIKAIGVTNQRETTLVWDKETGEPLYNAIVWLDLRTQSTVERLINKTPGRNKNHLKHKTGLPISTYFSAVKLRWLMDNVDEVHKAVVSHRAMFGTVDSWLIWCLTGGKSGGVHCTDVTNASRTMLFNIHTMDWDPELCKYFGIPMEILPRVRSSSEIYGLMIYQITRMSFDTNQIQAQDTQFTYTINLFSLQKSGALSGIPISGCLGDQSAALVGQMCFQDGQAKNTYGTGCFLLRNTGVKPVMSDHGLLTTVAYKLGRDKPACYALEGSVAIAGAVVRWLQDNLGIIGSSEELEKLAASVGTSYGCYFVPAFSGLYAPYWEPSARGIICGLTQFTNKSHLAFAALEAVCFQTREILDAMNQDSGIPLTQLQVDGGMTSNRLLMQLQADILCIPVAKCDSKNRIKKTFSVKPSMPETTALGAAMAAGAAEGVSVWSLNPEDLSEVTSEKFEPQINPEESEFRYARWKKAVQKSMNWETTEPLCNGNGETSIFSSAPLGFYIIGSMVMLIGAKYLAGCLISDLRPAENVQAVHKRNTVKELLMIKRQIQREAQRVGELSPEMLIMQDADGDTDMLRGTTHIILGRCLHIAVAQGRRALAYVLAAKMANCGSLDVKEHNRQTALQIATASNQHLIVQDLLGLGAQVDTRDLWGRSPLHVCAEKGHFLSLQNIWRTVMERGSTIDVEMFNYDGFTPLHAAVMSHNAVVKELGSLENPCSYMAMELVERKKTFVECVKTLLLMGASFGTKDLKSGRTCLHMASEEANMELLNIFLDHPSSLSFINAKTFSGNTALHIVSSLQNHESQVDAVKLLMRKGADSGNRNFENELPSQLVPEGPVGEKVNARSSYCFQQRQKCDALKNKLSRGCNFILIGVALQECAR
ncbi:hypothetical protein L3Q82_009946 [Scortum barcoo]|uniref:Uncharacterized protein n=1 Tax=Scortum barcoo TaxID=214431 RepID=A0ACB8WDM7_9TELE|nr:hypothetical protein L3Q82_009946 [Scortum barcoo]